jgi:hypothetical protein
MGQTYRPQPNELWKYRWLTGPDDRHSGETLTIFYEKAGLVN